MAAVMLLLRLQLVVVVAVGLCLFTFSSVVAQQGSVLVDGRLPIATIDHDFICATLDWWPPQKCDYGTCTWGTASLLNLDLNNNLLLNAVKAFSPLKLRLGGTLQDKVIYDDETRRRSTTTTTGGHSPSPCPSFIKNDSEMFGFTQGCLPMSRWDELNTFFNKAGAVVIFGLNALNGRTLASDASAAALGPWNSSNAEALMAYSVNKGYTIYAWELGNELSGNGVGTKVSAAQYASDVIKLHSIVKEFYKGFRVKPQIIAPGGFFSADWYKELVDKTPNSLDVVTHHIYNLGPGVDSHLVEKILDPTYLDREMPTFKQLNHILKTATTRAIAWVGEAGGAYNSGHNLVTNAFVFSFWYLDQLGMASKYDTKTYCRQTLIGGNYGLLNTTTFVPNPDYYSALLWHQLMGTNVLSTTFMGTKKIRAYSHCAKQSKGIVLLLINLDGNTTVDVQLSTETAPSDRRSSTLKHQYRYPFAEIAAGKGSSEAVDKKTRAEYHLTAKDGELHSQTMLLNGNVLAISSTGEIPLLEPTSVNILEPIRVAPYSIVFTHIPSLELPACTTSEVHYR